MSHSQSAGQQLSVNDLSVVIKELNNTRAKWYDIGLQLCMNVDTLDAIQEQYDDPSHCLRETLTTWLKTCPSPTWKNIVYALRSITIGEVRLAADLEQKYCSTQDTSVAVTHHHALPAPPSQADTQTTSPQQSQLPAHAPLPLALPVPPSQADTQMTALPPQYTTPPMQPPVFASYSISPPSHPPPWSAPYYYSPHTGYPLPTPFSLTPPPPGVATASVHPSYSQLTQVTPTSSLPILPSIPAQPTARQLPTALPQYPSPPSLTTIPPDTSSIPPPATVTTPPDLPPPVTVHTLGKKAEIGIFCTMFHLKNILLHKYIATCTPDVKAWCLDSITS